MQQNRNINLDKEIFLVIDNSTAKWQSIFDSTLHGALNLFLVSTKQTTGHYLSSIKEIYVTFIQNTVHFHFSLFSAWCLSLIPSFLSFILFIFTVFIISLFSTHSAFSLINLCQKYKFSVKSKINQEFYKKKLHRITSATLFSLVFHTVLSIFRLINYCSFFFHSVYIRKQIIQ